MRIFSLVAAVIVSAVVGFLLFHEPYSRNALDTFAALNIEAALSAVNGTLIASFIFVAARSLLYLLAGILANLIRLRSRKLAVLKAVTIVLMKIVLAWGLYLLLFSYSRNPGFSRVLWNLQDLGLISDAASIFAIGAVNIVSIAILPDLVAGLIFGAQEQEVLARRAEKPALHEDSAR